MKPGDISRQIPGSASYFVIFRKKRCWLMKVFWDPIDDAPFHGNPFCEVQKDFQELVLPGTVWLFALQSIL